MNEEQLTRLRSRLNREEGAFGGRYGENFLPKLKALLAIPSQRTFFSVYP